MIDKMQRNWREQRRVLAESLATGLVTDWLQYREMVRELKMVDLFLSDLDKLSTGIEDLDDDEDD